ncbi:mCG140477 [Mus musculus]|nr:mCG140477 [Mus musculus]
MDLSEGGAEAEAQWGLLSLSKCFFPRASGEEAAFPFHIQGKLHTTQRCPVLC